MKERKAYSIEATLLVEIETRLKCKANLANPNQPTNHIFAEIETKNHEMNAIT